MLLALAALAAAGCGTGGSSEPPATSETAKLAKVQAAFVCEVARTNYPTEQQLKAALVTRLRAADLTYSGWKQWHDSLVESRSRAAQLASFTHHC
ncbi:MAG: hypothetical protein JF603_06680 [Acidobacteria bacterium]|nr:hypothetical protein [Acidobacteriota bacterium]